MVAVLIVALFIIFSGAVLRTTVDALPRLAADVTEIVSAFAACSSEYEFPSTDAK